MEKTNTVCITESKDHRIATLEKALKSANQRIADYKADYKRVSDDLNRVMEENSKKVREIQALKRQIAKSNEPQEQFQKKLENETIFFCAKVATFIKEVGGYVWLTDYINEMPDYEKRSYLIAINNIGAWVENIRENINR